MNPQHSESGGATLHDYIGVLSRRRYVITSVVVAAILVAYLLSARQTPMYSATSTLAYESLINVSQPLSGSYYSNIATAGVEVQGVDSAIKGPEISGRLGEIVGADVVEVADYTVKGAAKKPDRDSMYTNLASITVTSSNPEQAAALANGYAKALIEFRVERQKELIQKAERALESKLKGFADPVTQTSADYILLKQRLQDLQILKATLTGDFRVVTPAEVPEEPFEPKPLRSALLGLGIGLFAGIGVAFLLEQLDTRLRDYREAAEILQMPVIGRIPRVVKKIEGDDPLVVVSRPAGRSAESYRLLRGNLEFMNVDGEMRSVFIASCLAGEGKSTTVANLAASLALGGKNVLLLDGDLRKPSLHAFFDLSNDAGLSTVLVGKTGIDDALQEATLLPQSSVGGNGSGPEPVDDSLAAKLMVLPAGPPPPNPGELIASRRFGQLIEELQDRFDLVLIDTPAMMAVGDVAALAASIQGLMMLVDFEVVSRSTLREARDIVDPLPCRKIGIIAAQERIKQREAYRYGYYGYGSTKTDS